MTVLVTGGAGFIGSAIVKALVARGEDVVVLDNFSRGQREVKGANYIRGDIRLFDHVGFAMQGCKSVIHCAYINGTETFYKEPSWVLEVAVKGMVNLLDACAKHNVKEFTLLSSSEVARVDVPGETTPLVIPDLNNPRYSYSGGKIISEMLGRWCGFLDKFLIVRPFNIYGPGMSKGHVVPDFMEKMKAIPIYNDGGYAANFPILGDGSETRSFCYIDDFIKGLMLVLDKGKHNEVYNIGTGYECTIKFLAVTLAEVMGRKIIVQSGGGLREGEMKRRRPEIAKLRELGYDPSVSLVEGLRWCVHEAAEAEEGVLQ